jgi:hypothetical protein
MKTEAQAFHLKEFESLRSEVAVLLARIENLFKYSCIAAATVIAWLLTNSLGLAKSGEPCLLAPGELTKWAWTIPAFFAYAALFLAFVNNIRVQRMGKYLRMAEAHLGDNLLGWEKYSQPGFPWLTVSTGVVWFALVAGSTYAGKTGFKMVESAASKNSICEPKK